MEEGGVSPAMKTREEKYQKRISRYIKDLESRVSDLEQTSQADFQSNILVTVDDSVALGDSIESVQTHTVQPARWGETGWGISSWSE